MRSLILLTIAILLLTACAWVVYPATPVPTVSARPTFGIVRTVEPMTLPAQTRSP